MKHYKLAAKRRKMKFSAPEIARRTNRKQGGGGGGGGTSENVGTIRSSEKEGRENEPRGTRRRREAVAEKGD